MASNSPNPSLHLNTMIPFPLSLHFSGDQNTLVSFHYIQNHALYYATNCLTLTIRITVRIPTSILRQEMTVFVLTVTIWQLPTINIFARKNNRM